MLTHVCAHANTPMPAVAHTYDHIFTHSCSWHHTLACTHIAHITTHLHIDTNTPVCSHSHAMLTRAHVIAHLHVMPVLSCAHAFAHTPTPTFTTHSLVLMMHTRARTQTHTLTLVHTHTTRLSNTLVPISAHAAHMCSHTCAWEAPLLPGGSRQPTRTVAVVSFLSIP